VLFGALALAALPAGCTAGSIAQPAAEPAAPEEPAPVKAADVGKWAGIDVGSRGVKPIAIDFVNTTDGWDFTTDTSLESRNTDLGTLNDDNSGFDPNRRDAAVAAIAELEKALREKHKLPPERVRVVVSSGVFTRFKDKEKADTARLELTVAVEKAIGRAPDFINEFQEAELAARAIIGPAGRAGRMMIDVGSGNTKFGWYTDAGFQTFTLDSGTKAFRDAAVKQAEARKQPFAEAAEALRETALVVPLREKVGKAPGFDKVTDVQLIGGAPWALATFTHPGSGKELRVRLTAADIEAFAKLAKLKPEAAREAVAALTEATAKAAGAKEIERVQKVFSPEELQAAAEILRATFAEGKLDARKVSFFQKGQFAWIAGYLMVAAKLSE
jgi:exopolyphosphatase/pppGpp-phosphohydrolase